MLLVYVNKFLFFLLYSTIICALDLKLSTKLVSYNGNLEARLEYSDQDESYFITQKIDLVSPNHEFHTVTTFNPQRDKLTFLQIYVGSVDERKIVLTSVDYDLQGWKIVFTIKDTTKNQILRLSSDPILVSQTSSLKSCGLPVYEKPTIKVLEDSSKKKLLVEWNEDELQLNENYMIGICFDSKKCSILLSRNLTERRYNDGVLPIHERKEMKINFIPSMINSFFFLISGNSELKVSSTKVIIPDIHQNIKYEKNKMKWANHPNYNLSEIFFFELNEKVGARRFIGKCQIESKSCVLDSLETIIENISPTSITFKNQNKFYTVIQTETKINIGKETRVIKSYLIKSPALTTCKKIEWLNMATQIKYLRGIPKLWYSENSRMARSDNSGIWKFTLDNLHIILPVTIIIVGFLTGGIVVGIYIFRSVEKKNEFQIFY